MAEHWPINWTDIDGTPQTTTLILDPPSGEFALRKGPIIILLHGASGNADHMAAPDLSPGVNFDLTAPDPDPGPTDRGWHYYPNFGYWSISGDPLKRVRGWQPMLRPRFATVNYSQI